MRVIIDAEFDGLLDTVANCWCIVCRDIDSPEDVYVFETPIDWERFHAFAEHVDLWVGHNLIGYDSRALRRVSSHQELRQGNTLDTLVLSRLLNFHIEHGHSLEAWGDRLEKKLLTTGPETWYNSGQAGQGKDTYSVLRSGVKDTSKEKLKDVSFNYYSKELLERCVSDTLINLAVYRNFEKYLNHPAFAKAIPTEMQTAWLCNTLNDNGFAFDREGAQVLFTELSDRLSALDGELKAAFPPVKTLKSEITPRVTKDGVIFAADFRRLEAAGYTPEQIKPGELLPIYEMIEFNPGSHKQIIERLNEAGWQPTEKTTGHREAVKDKSTSKEKRAHFKTYGWTLDDDNLATLPDTAPPAAKRLVERLLLKSRTALLEKWLVLVRTDGRIHGTFNGIGAWTHRMSHAEPNMANVPKAKTPPKVTEVTELSNKINNRMRAFWRAQDGWRLLGVDADAIHMRIFAHLCNDAALIDAIVNGDKNLGTDIHSFNQKLLGSVCASRDVAKTFIYALLNGAGAGKCAEIFKCSFEQAKAALDQYIERLPGFKRLKKERFPADLKRGYFESIDGRYVLCDDPRNIMSGYLQSGEIVIMKGAAILWNEVLTREGVPFNFVDFVHDEWQTEVLDDEAIARYVVKTQLDSLVAVGASLGLHCPIAGTAVYSLDGHRFADKKVGEKNEFAGGYNWKITH